MPTISNKLVALAAAMLAGPASAQPVVGAGACSSHLAALAPKLQDSGYRISWGSGGAPAAPLFLEAAHVEPSGRVSIEYRCGADGLDVTVVNHGLPDIPFHVLLAAGPSAKLAQAMPDWLKRRDEAVRR